MAFSGFRTRAAIWGLESNYGSIRGDVPVISALATLAAQGRRAAMFEAQLLAAFEIVTRGIKSPDQMLGSWAGASGNYLHLTHTLSFENRVMECILSLFRFH